MPTIHPHSWRWLLWPHLALILAATIAAYLNLIPHGLFTWPYADKICHFVLFGLLSFLLRAWIPWQMAAAWPLVGAGIEELTQAASRYRTSDIWDFAADAAGVIIFQLIYRVRSRRASFRLG